MIDAKEWLQTWYYCLTHMIHEYCHPHYWIALSEIQKMLAEHGLKHEDMHTEIVSLYHFPEIGEPVWQIKKRRIDANGEFGKW